MQRHMMVGVTRQLVPDHVISANGDRYSLGASISNGVFIGRKYGHSQEVIVKILDSPGTIKEKRFKNEAFVLSKLNHSKISKYVGESEIQVGNILLPAIIMQKGFVNLWTYKHGASFFEPRTFSSASRFVDSIRENAIDMLDAMEYLHAQKFLHRDIKPANFIFKDARCSEIMMIDLGLAKYDGQDDEFVRYFADVTESGESVGPKHIFSPELVAYAADKRVIVDARSDLWQFSRVLWFLVIGNLSTGRPSRAKDPSGGKISALVDDMMHEDPGERVQSIAEIRNRVIGF